MRFTRFIVRFYECENGGDLEHYLRQIPRSVATVVGTNVGGSTCELLVDADPRALREVLDANEETAGLYSLHKPR